VVVVAIDNALKAADGVLERDVLARRAGKDFGDMKRLREKALDLARAGHGLFVFFGQFIHAEDGDNVLEFLVLLQGCLHPARGVVVFVADDVGVKLAAGGIERIDRRINPEGSNIARKHDRRIQMRKGGRGRGVGQIIRWYVHGLDGGDRARAG